MKKTFIKLLISALSLVFVFTGLFACGGSSWSPKNVTLTNPGAVKENGGFIAETENYLYFINGIGTSTDDNALGAPVKGSLVVADKNDLTKTCVVVPKLFVATDYNAGVFIDGGYIYYGTPSTDRKPDGSIANDEMAFARTGVDGKNTETFFTVPALSTEYRIVKGADEKVYIIYYDTEDTALKVYNTSTKTASVIAKTTDEAVKESLGSYKFTVGGDYSVMYTVSVYGEEFDADLKKELGDGYSRSTESYNKVYAYKLGDETKEGEVKGTLVFDGKANGGIEYNYAFTHVTKGYAFVTETDGTANANSKTIAVKTTDLASKTEIKNTSLVADTSLINDLNEVYAIENSNRLVKTTLTGSVADEKQGVAIGSFSKLLFVDADYMYYINSNNEIARVYIGSDRAQKTEEEKMEQRVSESTVATSWYAPEVVGGKLFYVDNSADGCSYVKYVSLDAQIKDEKDDADKVTLRYLDGNTFVGIMTANDKASIVTNEINALSSVLENGAIKFDLNDDETIKLVDGKPVVQAIVDARASYDALAGDKKLVSEETVALLEKYEYAYNLNVIFYALDGFDTATDKDGFRTAYDTAKAELQKLKDSKVYDYAEMRGMIQNNLNFFYQEADEHFSK